MGQQAAYTFAHKPLAEAQRMGRRSTGSFAANRGYYAAPQAVHPSNVSMPALPAYHRRTTSSSSSIGSHGGSEAGGLAAYQSAPPRWQGSHLNTWAEPFSPRSQQQYLASQPAPPPYARVHSLPAHPQRSHGSEPAGDAYWQQHWRSGSDWHQPQLSADALPSYTLPQMAVHGGAVGGASAGGWSNSGMPYSAPASTATSPTLYSAGLPPLPPPPPGMPSSTAPPPPPPLLSVPVLDLQVRIKGRGVCKVGCWLSFALGHRPAKPEHSTLHLAHASLHARRPGILLCASAYFLAPPSPPPAALPPARCPSLLTTPLTWSASCRRRRRRWCRRPVEHRT